MKITPTKVTEPSNTTSLAYKLAHLHPDPKMTIGEWARKTAKRLGVTPNAIYKALDVK